MAYTVSVLEKTTFGNKKVHVLDVTADAATQAVVTGLSVVNWFSYGPITMTDGHISIFKNTTASGVAANGTLGVSGATSGDRFFLTVFGN